MIIVLDGKKMGKAEIGYVDSGEAIKKKDTSRLW